MHLLLNSAMLRIGPLVEGFFPWGTYPGTEPHFYWLQTTYLQSFLYRQTCRASYIYVCLNVRTSTHSLLPFCWLLLCIFFIFQLEKVKRITRIFVRWKLSCLLRTRNAMWGIAYGVKYYSKGSILNSLHPRL